MQDLGVDTGSIEHNLLRLRISRAHDGIGGWAKNTIQNVERYDYHIADATAAFEILSRLAEEKAREAEA